jgi:hypothetical protein
MSPPDADDRDRAPLPGLPWVDRASLEDDGDRAGVVLLIVGGALALVGALGQAAATEVDTSVSQRLIFALSEPLLVAGGVSVAIAFSSLILGWPRPAGRRASPASGSGHDMPSDPPAEPGGAT